MNGQALGHPFLIGNRKGLPGFFLVCANDGAKGHKDGPRIATGNGRLDFPIGHAHRGPGLVLHVNSRRERNAQGFHHAVLGPNVFHRGGQDFIGVGGKLLSRTHRKEGEVENVRKQANNYTSLGFG